MKLRLHRLAVAEIHHEVDYYESKQPGLGSGLENEIDAVLRRILRFPESAPQWADRPQRRLAVLDRFPFTIPYQIVGEEIVVLALAHTSRRPGWLLGATEVATARRDAGTAERGPRRKARGHAGAARTRVTYT